ncbi:hypothetical protein QE395_000618 [Stenotrophomonas sp. SORGH_AS 282]|nr:hypothetical protein [Stenotrophomonas sp. SORGH_AS_0282]
MSVELDALAITLRPVAVPPVKEIFSMPGVFGQCGADPGAITGQYVEHAIGQAGFGEDFGQLQRGQRGHFAGLEDHRIARRERRGRLPQRDLDRVVPGADRADHAQRFLPCVEEAAFAQRHLAAFQPVHYPGVVLQHVRAGDDVHAAGFAQRFAGVEAFQFGQVVVAFAQQCHRAQQDARALHGGERGPGLLAGMGAFHRGIQVVAVGAVHIGKHLAVGRVDHFEGAVALRGHMAAADVQQLVGEGGHVDDSCLRRETSGFNGSDAGTAGGARTGR